FVTVLLVITLCCLFLFLIAAPTETCTLSLHDALPISGNVDSFAQAYYNRASLFARLIPAGLYLSVMCAEEVPPLSDDEIVRWTADRKSTRLNSSHVKISYAVFCLKKKTYKEVIV